MIHVVSDEARRWLGLSMMFHEHMSILQKNTPRAFNSSPMGEMLLVCYLLVCDLLQEKKEEPVFTLVLILTQQRTNIVSGAIDLWIFIELTNVRSL